MTFENSDWPSGRGTIPAGAFGRELKTDDSRIGYLDDGNLAWPERVAAARMQWPEADPGDFERAGRRRWVDKASGVTYIEPGGAPLLSSPDANRAIVAFLVADDGKMHFLARTDVDVAVTLTVSGPVRGGVVEGNSIRWEGT
jgi:hypothetical protein